jgi:hypothetical protein
MKKYYLLITFWLLSFISINIFGQTTPVPEVLHYKFDEQGVFVTNYASNPPIGTDTAIIMGAVTQGGSGQCGGALIGSGLSSSSDYLNTGWAPNLGTGPWTISFWSSGISVSATLYYVFGDLNTGSLRCFTNGVAGPNNFILRGPGIIDVYANGAAQLYPTLTTFVYDPTLNNISAYVNGVLSSSVAQAAPNLTGAGPFKVMGYNTTIGSPAGGLMDDFRVYSHALTPAEVMQLYTQQSSSTISVVSCGSYTAPSGATFLNSGNYNDTIPNIACGDSVITINLTVNQASNSSIQATSCNSYVAPSGIIYTTSGIYNDTIQNAVGCDSVITINLTVNQATNSSIQETSCNSYVAPSGIVYTTSGIYNDTLQNAIGCDSIITINLTINQTTTTSIQVASCNSYVAPSGTIYLMSGMYNDTITNSTGCDSIITIDLIINQSSADTLLMIECDSASAPDGSHLFISGEYDFLFTNLSGCDSLIHVNLTINQSSASSLNESAIDSYTLNNQTYTQSGTYTQIIPNALGCDSTITLNLTLGYTAINEFEENISVYPNPSTTEVMISSSIDLNEDFNVFDQLGREVISGKLKGYTTLLDVSNLMNGNYFIQIKGISKPIKFIKL